MSTAHAQRPEPGEERQGRRPEEPAVAEPSGGVAAGSEAQRAADPLLRSGLGPRDILRLQQTIGNRAVQRLLATQPARPPVAPPVQRKEVEVTITTATRPRQLSSDGSSLIHGKSGEKFEVGDATEIDDEKTFRSRLQTDKRKKGYRKNPTNTIWYQLTEDEDPKEYLRSGTFIPSKDSVGSDFLVEKQRELKRWLFVGTYDNLVLGFQKQKLLRTHANWMVEALRVLNAAGADEDDIRTPALALFRYLRIARSQPGDGDVFKQEVLQASGWAEAKAVKGIPAIRDIALVIDLAPLYKRSKGKSKSTSGARDEELDSVKLVQDLPGALVALLEKHDPGKGKSVAQPLDRTMSGKADLIQKEAVAFFPYARASQATLKMVHGPWQYSKNLVDLQAEDPSRSRLALLENRARMSEIKVLKNAHFNDSVESDRKVLTAVLTKMLEVKTVVDLVDRHILATPRRSGGETVYMQTVLEARGTTAEESQWMAQWQMIRSMCHELLHVLVHPNFAAAANKIENSQVVDEGFVEVLGVALYNHILAKARDDMAGFGRNVTAGLAQTGVPPDVGKDDLGYGKASQRALTISDKVGQDRFEGAFFLGKPSLVGIS